MAAASIDGVGINQENDVQEIKQDFNIFAPIPDNLTSFVKENELILQNLDVLPDGQSVSLFDVNDQASLEFSNTNIFKPLIAEDDYRAEVVTVNSLYGSKTVVLDVPGKPIEEYQQAMWNDLNEFNENSWQKSKGIKTGFDGIDKAFDGGLQSGFTIIAADSNIGKTAFMSQIEWNVVKNNPDVYVMSFSLDDPKPDKISRIVSIDQGLPINLIKYPGKYSRLYPLAVLRREIGLSELRKSVDRYRIYDSTFSSYAEDIEKEVEEKTAYFKANNINKQIVVFIDNFHDMEVKSNAVEKAKWEELASFSADLAIKFDIPVVCTAELKKLNGTRRPTLDDIREATKIKYEAKAVLLCYNELHYKENNAEVYFDDPQTHAKGPIFEVHFAKNKLGPFKGRVFFKFYPEKATMQECTSIESTGFKQKILNQKQKSFVN